jgi:iron(III) transport system permease protein
MSSARWAAAPFAPPTRRVRRLVPESGLQAAIEVLVLACVVIPIAPLLYASVQDKPIYLPGRSFTFSAYSQLLRDAAFRQAALNTLEFAGIATVASVVLGAAAAVLCTRTDVVGARVFGGLFVVPILLPPLGTILGWNALYGLGGYGHNFITGTLRIPFNLGSVPGMAVLGTATVLPAAFLICRAALSSMDTSLENAARSAGASPLRVLATVTLPMLRPALVNAALLVFTLSIESLGIPLVLGSAQGHDLIASYLFQTWSGATTPDPPTVSAGAMLLLLAACALLLLRSRLLGDQARFVSIGGRGSTNTGIIALGRVTRWVLGGLLALYLVATSLAPLVALALESVTSVLTPQIAPWHVLTGTNWREAWSGPNLQSIKTTLKIAGGGAVAVTALVALATAVAQRSRFRLRRPLPFLLLFPRAMPGIIIGIGFFWSYVLVNPPGHALLTSTWGMFIALSVRGITLAYFVLSSAFGTVSQAMDDAGRSAGASWWTTMTRITLPILRPALFVTFVLVFVSILSDYDPALFLVTPGNEIIGVSLLQAAAQGTAGPAAALAMVQVVLTVIAIAVAAPLFIRRVLRPAKEPHA